MVVSSRLADREAPVKASESVYPTSEDTSENFAIRAIKREAFMLGIAYALDPDNLDHLEILSRGDWMHDDPGIPWGDASEDDRDYIRQGIRAAISELRNSLMGGF